MRLLTFFCLLLLLASCAKNEKSADYTKEELNVTTSVYPEAINAVFEAHGGIDAWNAMNGLYFEIAKEDGNEKHYLDLKSRKSVNYYKQHVLGYDGKRVWLKKLDTTSFRSNPRFYYNLMSYFYAMPFIVGDDGINYAEAPVLEADGKEYPGVLISYGDGVGESPEDEYIVYYDPETKQMTWLAYTVTFFSKEKSKKFSLIKYGDWEAIHGVVLPTTLQWHVFEDGEVGDIRNQMTFANAKLQKEAFDQSMFQVAEGAELVE